MFWEISQNSHETPILESRPKANHQAYQNRIPWKVFYYDFYEMF